VGRTHGEEPATRGRATERSRAGLPARPNRGTFRCIRLCLASPTPAGYASALARDDVMNLEQLGLARKPDSNVLQHRHEALTERVEMLA
jgi:hypothetical protein